jgi:hypothetical protein
MRKLIFQALMLLCAGLASMLTAQAQVTIGQDRAPQATLDVEGDARIVRVEESTTRADVLVWDTNDQIVKRIALPPNARRGSVIIWNGDEWVIEEGAGVVRVRRGGGIEIRDGELTLIDCQENQVLVFRNGNWVCGFAGGGVNGICVEAQSVLRIGPDGCIGIQNGTNDGDVIIWDADAGRWVIAEGGFNRRNWLIGGNDNTSLTDPNRHFIGTLHDFPFIVRTNNEQRMQVTADGKVVVNRFDANPAPNSRLASYGSGTEFGVIGFSNGITERADVPFGAGVAGVGNNHGVYGQSNSANPGATGVYGLASNTDGATFGVFGISNSSSDGAGGVVGQAGGASGWTYGVIGESYSASEAAAGVYGVGVSEDGINFGLYGESYGSGNGSSGIFARSFGDGDFSTYGLFGVSLNRGAGSAGVIGVADNPGGERTAGVIGANNSEGSFSSGVQGLSQGAGAEGGTYYGVWGAAIKGNDATGIGVFGEGNKYGVVGRAPSAPGSFSLFGQNNIGAVGFKQFHIDHPIDPANKVLNHVCPESSEPLNIYSGNIKTDASGFATVELPSYFEAINTDVRYTLTVVGQFAQAVVIEKVRNNRFRIQTDKPNVEVSWMVSARRNDAYAKANPFVAEQMKAPAQRGKYLAPELHGQPASQGIFYNPNAVQQTKGTFTYPGAVRRPLGRQFKLSDNTR